MEYEIYYCENKVGVVKLSKCGMFYRLSGRFQIPEQGAFHLLVENGINKTDLGQCVPYGLALGMERCFPIKRIGEENLHFSVIPADCRDMFIPIDEGQPFHHINKLLNARFAIQSGEKGILLDV